MKFKMKNRNLSIQQPLICGILNVTPDSFSDGGKHYQTQEAIRQAKYLIREGADMIDIGGESTRPHSTYIEIQEEIDRIVPVIKEIRFFSDIPISVDTWKAEVADAALNAGADVINDITGLLGDEEMANVIAGHQAGLILMFNPVKIRPHHPDAKNFPQFGPSVFSEEEIDAYQKNPIESLMAIYFSKALSMAKEAGISKNAIMLDPGVGFGLTKEENFRLINQAGSLREKGYFVYLGVSRKRFLASVLDDLSLTTDFDTRPGLDNMDNASSMITTFAVSQGVHAVRVHDIKKHRVARQIGQELFQANGNS